MLGMELTTVTILTIAALLSFGGLVYAALRLGRRHRREQEQDAELDSRHRTIFRPGAPDRLGDRTAELLNDLHETETGKRS